MIEVEPIVIDIGGSDSGNILDDIRALQPIAINKKTDEDTTVLISNHKRQPKKKKEKKKKSDKSILTLSDTSDLIITDEDIDDEKDIQTLLDLDKFEIDQDKIDSTTEDIVNMGKKGYKKLKNGNNNYKKEFAEEITLLYSLLDETTQYGKDLEKDLKSMKSSKVRGVSKYSNDLATLVLNAKQTKLNILKEITSVKKSIVDLGIKENKGNDKKNNGGTAEALAAHYFKNVLSHGRTDFINRYSDDERDMNDVFGRSNYTDKEEYDLNSIMEDRLTATNNPFRTDAGNKYIEYENLGVEIRVSKCIDTGEWEFIAIDKTGRRIDDYPLPDRRTSGRMRFSDDGDYATDQMGRIYKVVEYYLPDDEDDEY